MFNFNDGGRSKYFKALNAGDCVVRSIAIATGLDYKVVYDELAERNKMVFGKRSARDGLHWDVYRPYLISLDFELCKAPRFEGRKARPSDLPSGVVIANQAQHFVCVIDGVCQDTFDSSDKMVYNYWKYFKNN
jgi:hypothetical protein